VMDDNTAAVVVLVATFLFLGFMAWLIWRD
jgi:hypothetical protein